MKARGSKCRLPTHGSTQLFSVTAHQVEADVVCGWPVFFLQQEERRFVTDGETEILLRAGNPDAINLGRCSHRKVFRIVRVRCMYVVDVFNAESDDVLLWLECLSSSVKSSSLHMDVLVYLSWTVQYDSKGRFRCFLNK